MAFPWNARYKVDQPRVINLMKVSSSWLRLNSPLLHAQGLPGSTAWLPSAAEVRTEASPRMRSPRPYALALVKPVSVF